MMGGAVEVPGGAEPAFHEGGEGAFEEGAGAEEDRLAFFVGGGLLVILEEALAVGVEFGDEEEVLVQIGGGGFFRFCREALVEEVLDFWVEDPAGRDRRAEDEQGGKAAEEFQHGGRVEEEGGMRK